MPAAARRIADDVLGFARKNNVTHIIIGKSTRSRWFEMLQGSVVHDLVRRAGNISVHVIAGEDAATGAADNEGGAGSLPRHSPLIRFPTLLPCWPWLQRSPSASSGSTPLRARERRSIFLTAIVGIAVRYGLWPSLVATVAASLSYNFFFLPPVYTFTITDPTNIAAFVLFTVVAVVVSNLAARGWSQTVGAQERVRSIEFLYAFSRKLAGAGTLDDVLWATAYQIASMLKVRVVLLLPEHGSIALKTWLSAGKLPRRGRLGGSQVGVGEELTCRPRL